MPGPYKLINRIRSLRFGRGRMTQKDLAAKVGVTRQTIIAIEKAKYSPSLELAFQIADALNASVTDVFFYGLHESRCIDIMLSPPQTDPTGVLRQTPHHLVSPDH